MSQNNARIASEITLLQHRLNKAEQFARAQLPLLKTQIIAYQGDNTAITRLLTPYIDQGDSLVRFAWINDEDKLVLTSAHQRFAVPYDVSARSYVKAARRHPATLYTSRIMQHVARDTPVFSVALGVPLKEGRYLGTVIAAFNLGPIIEEIKLSMQDCGCVYHVVTRYGEAIAPSRGALPPNLLQPAIKAGHMRVEGAMEPALYQRLLNDYLLLGALCWLGLHVGMIASYLGYRRFILRPVEHALVTYNKDALPAATPFSSKLAQLGKMAAHFQSMEQEWQASRSALAKAEWQLAALSQVQRQFFASSGSEMRAAHLAIRHYADYLEELALHGAIESDAALDYDDVREMGENLHTLAASFTHLCQLTPLENAPEPSELYDVVVHSFIPLSDAAERRLIDLRIIPFTAALPVRKETLEHLFQVLSYAAIRFARDESVITIQYKPQQLIMMLSHYRRELLPPAA